MSETYPSVPNLRQKIGLTVACYAIGVAAWLFCSDPLRTACNALFPAAAGYLGLLPWLALALSIPLYSKLLTVNFGVLGRDLAQTQREHERLLAIIASFDYGILVFDLDTICIDCHRPSGRSAYPYPWDFVDRPLADVPLAATTIAQFAAAFARLRDDEVASAQIEYSVDQQADPISFLARVFPLRDGEGQLAGYAAVVRDVTERKHAERLLQQSERKYRMLFEHAVDAIFVADAESGMLVDANPRALEILGYEMSELRRKHQSELHPPAQLAAVASRLLNSGNGILDGQFEIDLIHRDGHLIPIEISPSVVVAEDAQPLVFGIFRDISERRRSQAELRLAAKVFEASGEAIFVTDAKRRIVLANPAFTRITGYRAEKIIGRTPKFLASGKHDPEFFKAIWHELEVRGHWQGEVWNRRRNGESFPEWLGISTVRDEGGAISNYVAIFADMSEKKEVEARLAYLAHHDALTGLPNRILLRDRLDQAIAQAQRAEQQVALLFLDLDHFKIVNDTLGHLVGDRLLQTVVARLLDSIRATDTVSRLGGDEFLVVLADIPDPAIVARITDDILEQAQQPVAIDGHTLTPSFSIGIALYPDDGHDFDTLLRLADTAMYHAKEAGRNTYRFFTEQMNRDASLRLRMRGELQQALEQNQLRLHYQPQFDLQSGRLTGAEALMRWQHPGGSLIAPGTFIPIAEESGQIIAMGRWALFEACRQGARWREKYESKLTVAVNLSALQFRRGQLIDDVRHALAEAALPAGCLELELTESILLQDVDSTLDTLRQLKMLGVQLSVDDFGTGYSSLAYLKRFAVDKLKIDQSFIRDLAHDADDAAIVRAIVQLGHSLKLRTIAEGVEQEAQAQFLRDEGCNEVQGYLFGLPLPAEEFTRRFLAAQSDQEGSTPSSSAPHSQAAATPTPATQTSSSPA
jgi:diguanylate cyclase (GGDEF)-like protein/PAS domain S-box-containing protein